jgi:hypothetical protein
MVSVRRGAVVRPRAVWSIFLLMLVGAAACSEPPAGEMPGAADWDAATWRAEMLRHADQVNLAVDDLGWQPDTTEAALPRDRLDRFVEALSALEETIPPVAWSAELSDQGRHSRYRNLITDMRYAAQRLAAPDAPDAYGDSGYWAERLHTSLEGWAAMREELTAPSQDEEAS